MTVGIKSTHIELPENSSNPSTPSSGKTILYAKNDKLVYILGSGGTPVLISGDSTVLNDPDDVTITSPVNNQGLKYNGSAWVNSTIPTYPQVLDDVTDFAGTTKVAGQTVVSFNGSTFVNSKNKYGMFEKTGGTGTALYRSIDSLTNRIVYATAGANRQLGGDTEYLLDTYYFKPRQDATLNDFGVYRMDCWFRFEYIDLGSPPTSPSATISIKWAQITGLTINSQTTLKAFPFIGTDPIFVNVSYTFKATASTGKNYIFFVEKSNTQTYMMWHHMMIKKISHTVS